MVCEKEMEFASSNTVGVGNYLLLIKPSQYLAAANPKKLIIEERMSGLFATQRTHDSTLIFYLQASQPANHRDNPCDPPLCLSMGESTVVALRIQQRDLSWACTKVC